ncbi:MAG: SnoaL-like domain-containing protein [Erythrobacter sp.]
MDSIENVARDFTAMLRAGEFLAAGERYWAAEVASLEPAGEEPAAIGIVAVRARTERRLRHQRIEDIAIDGPFVTGNQFALFLDMTVVDRTSGTAAPFSEIAVFTVSDARITEERFFHD